MTADNNSPRLAPETHIGPVVLAARDRDRLAGWYGSVLGLQVLARDSQATVLGAPDGTPLVTLKAAPDARLPDAREPGLYHTAILLPSRADLGRWLRHTINSGIRLQGAADHLVSEAAYLADPEGNGVEIYRDRPRDEWQRANGRIRMANVRLDAPGIIADGDATNRPWDGVPEGTIVGHVHLKVADLDATRRFYEAGAGFDVTEENFPGALFVSAGGYHHHLGLNTWESAGGKRQGGRTGLAAATIVVPPGGGKGFAALGHESGAVVDPSGNRLIIAEGTVDAARALALAA